MFGCRVYGARSDGFTVRVLQQQSRVVTASESVKCISTIYKEEGVSWRFKNKCMDILSQV